MKGVFVLAICMVLCAMVVSEAVGHTPWTVRFNVEPLQIWGDLDSRSDLGLGTSVGAAYQMGRYWRLGASLGYAETKGDVEGTERRRGVVDVEVDVRAHYETTLVPLEMTSTFLLTQGGRMVPYVSMGWGISRRSVSNMFYAESVPRAVTKIAPLDTIDTGIEPKKWIVSLSGEIGAEFDLSEVWRVHVGVKGRYLRSDALDYVHRDGTAKDVTLGAAMGLVYSFGGRREVRVRTERETIPPRVRPRGFRVMTVGGMYPDRDGDGRPDVIDECPDEPEDYDGVQDRDGCPDLEEEREVLEDRDGDGIPDVKDRCPDQSETVNGYMDDDGCPDEAPMVIGTEPIVLPGMQFAEGSYALDPGMYSTLDRLAHTLLLYPEINIEIRGHTDNRGSVAANRTLSQKRAMAVRDYLVERGVSPGRLRPIGLGESRPVASNDTEEGRARNRSIEIRRIE